MPRKKKRPEEMSDRELMERVFPKRVIKAVDHEIGRDEPAEPESPSK